jgi:SAM-dependent methyltransferase
VGGAQVDDVGDATRRLPFEANSFDMVHASHILEHVAWYSAEATVREWARVLKPGGVLEVLVPDGLKIAQAFVDAETTGGAPHEQDGWWRFNPQRDPCLWFSGRLFSYGDGTGRQKRFNWRLATYSERRLSDLLRSAGLTDTRRLRPDEVRGYDHGWINLGVCGRKPERTAS